MKKIFPIIIVLISLSLLGLIYFQFIWLTTAKETKEILAGTAPPSINRWVDSVATSFTDPLELFRRLHEKSFPYWSQI
jgi:hypothetical protein